MRSFYGKGWGWRLRLAAQERPRERLAATRRAHLSDAELLASPAHRHQRQNAVDLARELCTASATSPLEPCQRRGLLRRARPGPGEYANWQAVMEIARRASRNKRSSATPELAQACATICAYSLPAANTKCSWRYFWIPRPRDHDGGIVSRLATRNQRLSARSGEARPAPECLALIFAHNHPPAWLNRAAPTRPSRVP